MRVFVFCAALLVIPWSGFAQTTVEMGIRSTFAEPIPLNISPFSAIDGTRPDHALELQTQLTKDLQFSGLFKIQQGTIPLASDGGTKGLIEVRGALLVRDGQVQFEGRVIDVDTKQQIGGKRYRIENNLRTVAHYFADEVVRMLTGENGIATTRIVFRRKTADEWEVVMCDYDGYNPVVLLRQTVPLVYPRWLDEDKGFTYSSFRYGKPDLFIRYLAEPASKQLARYQGLNYSVDWSEKRQLLAATLSKDGNSEIYLMTLDGKVKKRLTHTRAIDVSPSWSPSGREIVFTSDRTGTPQLYIMESDGSNVRRLTFQGGYNASPAWSPKGERIAFVSRIDGFFQLCTIRPDGSEFRTTADNAVNHEDPRWAPDGRHIVYTEEKGSESVITIIDIGTEGKRVLAKGDSADWSAR